ncbi:MAG: NADP-dependent isocitrate dehydrogenase [Phycisphaerae bacterium]|nr:NADP-dependent isocitrate dehydrogenase [Phycisphaerae bacterium]
MAKTHPILWTLTDEAPALATYSLLPIVRAFAGAAGVPVETRDISLSGRILAAFSDRLRPDQRIADDLAELGRIAVTPQANIIKLPNISASIPQLKAAIKELQAKGHALPDYPEHPTTDAERDAKARYDKVKGSAVNPVLREGNSDRRAPKSVKDHARRHPHKLGAWSKDSRSHVAHMEGGDFFGHEKSVTMPAATSLRIELVGADGAAKVLKDGIKVEAGEIVDATFMSRRAFVAFLEHQVADAKAKGVLFSLHLKATMMKVSDPIMFGHAVRAFFAPVFEKHRATLERLGVDPNNGFGDLVAKIAGLPEAERTRIEQDVQAALASGPAIAMVDSAKGITNLHVPSDVIVDASMPAMIRDSGRMWNSKGELQDAKAVIPDRCYAGVYQAVIDFCREHGAFDPRTMGSVPNVGLMAQKAEEYGSHDTTYEVAAAGSMRVVDAKGAVVLEHRVEPGDIWRMCRTKDAPVRDWVRLAVRRAKASGAPAVFWLDERRPHDRELIAKVHRELSAEPTAGLDLRILSPVDACRFSLGRMAAGQDTISVTGNVLRDYLTDLFPILELGTSAKMLSIVPLMQGGGLFETGAGGSAPKHVQQFEKENYLRWDSLGEFLALAASFEHLAHAGGGGRAHLLARTLDQATARHLLESREPARKVGGIDNRGSHFYLAAYWARALADQTEDAAIAARFRLLAEELEAKESVILAELNGVQGRSVDVGGYYRPDPARAAAAMRPSRTFNDALASLALEPTAAR